MSIKRGPDGVPYEEPTKINRDQSPARNKPGGSLMDFEDQSGSFGGEQATRPRTAADDSGLTMQVPGGSLFPDEPPTQAPKKAGGAASTASAGVENAPAADDLDEPKTMIYRNKAKPAATAPDAVAAAAAPVETDAMADPISGWLVIIDGPGKGHYVKLGYGHNSVGRSPNERVSLDFGDGNISRNNHLMITFDPRGKQFYVQQGTGTNMAYINDIPVMGAQKLEAFSHIALGDTTLRFVPLCGDDFTWD
ncbi:FHA domain-containing protein [Halioxenophilus sp. WMMB6]|uniref:FHA domain-containing protein n=1 Tax=Halioxenophilus sp. WMMB6 TaxID=3073815 RepID=UPI00295E41D4|nr:FHA domain-containing protein [Halioxenophilus sp. WMMB6]